MKIDLQLHPESYRDGNIVDSFLNKTFGFELSFISDTEKHKKILTLQQVVDLRGQIDKALASYYHLI